MSFVNFNDYQALAWRTRGEGQGLAIMALGLGGEAGEVCDLIKKHLGHGHPLDREKLVKELGDVLWYIACLAQLAGIDMHEIPTANIEKLRTRYPDGFSTERSMNRTEDAESCSNCGGQGKLFMDLPDGGGMYGQRLLTCPKCLGSGK